LSQPTDKLFVFGISVEEAKVEFEAGNQKPPPDRLKNRAPFQELFPEPLCNLE
jgi:hypothetical protein